MSIKDSKDVHINILYVLWKDRVRNSEVDFRLHARTHALLQARRAENKILFSEQPIRTIVNHNAYTFLARLHLPIGSMYITARIDSLPLYYYRLYVWWTRAIFLWCSHNNLGYIILIIISLWSCEIPYTDSIDSQEDTLNDVSQAFYNFSFFYLNTLWYVLEIMQLFEKEFTCFQKSKSCFSLG